MSSGGVLPKLGGDHRSSSQRGGRHAGRKGKRSGRSGGTRRRKNKRSSNKSKRAKKGRRDAAPLQHIDEHNDEEVDEPSSEVAGSELPPAFVSHAQRKGFTTSDGGAGETAVPPMSGTGAARHVAQARHEAASSTSEDPLMKRAFVLTEIDDDDHDDTSFQRDERQEAQVCDVLLCVGICVCRQNAATKVLPTGSNNITPTSSPRTLFCRVAPRLIACCVQARYDRLQNRLAHQHFRNSEADGHHSSYVLTTRAELNVTKMLGQRVRRHFIAVRLNFLPSPWMVGDNRKWKPWHSSTSSSSDN